MDENSIPATDSDDVDIHTITRRLYKILGWITSILVPVAIVLTAVRLVMTPALLYFEYNTPGFPPDPFGFTKEDRLYWSQVALDYLLNPEGIEFLENLRFEDGSPVYNARELRHMVDVKNTVRGVFYVWYISIGVLVIFGAWSWHSGWWEEYRSGLSRGGWLTILLIGTIILFVVVSFGVLFVAFHNVFFQPGTWTFFWNDTLIRLFPERFWRDIFLIVGGLSLAGGVALAIGLRPPKKPQI